MIWTALYIVIACFYVPFTIRTTIGGFAEERGDPDAVDMIACVFGGICLACVWPILALVWLADRGR